MTPSEIEAHRAGFEAWAGSQGFWTDRDPADGGKYAEDVTQVRWEGWLAAKSEPARVTDETRELLATAANALESRSLYARGEEQFLRCGLCGTPADDELGPQHTAQCFVSRLHAGAERGGAE